MAAGFLPIIGLLAAYQYLNRLAELMDAAVLYARAHTDINAVRSVPDPTRAGELVKVMP